MPLIRNDELVDDDFRTLADDEALPGEGGVIVSLARWKKDRDALSRRKAPLGVRLKSDESPEAVADDLGRLALVALEFPKFRDGRAYSYARILRERYGFRGEVRAVGDVLMEQLHFMLRTGFNAFELEGADPLGQYRTAKAEFSVWYQPTGDGRPTAVGLRHHLVADRTGH
jgi:uncharacterized protein (DUF934 family)